MTRKLKLQCEHEVFGDAQTPSERHWFLLEEMVGKRQFMEKVTITKLDIENSNEH